MAPTPTYSWLVRVTYQALDPLDRRYVLPWVVQSELATLEQARELSLRLLERARAHPEVGDPAVSIERRREGTFDGLEDLEQPASSAGVAASLAAARAALARHPCAAPDPAPVVAPVLALEARQR